MNKNLYFVGMVSIFEMLIFHTKRTRRFIFGRTSAKSAAFTESSEKNGQFAFPM